MLYERWRAIARESWNELALHDIATGRRLTFAELDRAADHGPARADTVAFPEGHSAEFVIDTLRAWRGGQTVCPVESSQPRPAPASLPPRCAHLKITSATTGPARLIGFNAEQLAADAENIVATMGLRRDWPNLGVISLAHSYGFSNLVVPLLLHGVPLLLAQPPLPEVLRQAAAHAEALTLPAVPALWRAWHEAGAIPPNIRLAISAGAPLPLALERAIFAANGIKIHNFYGASECGGIAYDKTECPRPDAAGVGTAMNNVHLSVADDGCLEVRSRAVAQTYWPDTDSTLGNGCFHSSDLAAILDGRIFLGGRAGDQINVAGRKVAPESIEQALAAHPLVRDCLVFGVPCPGEQRTEIVVACVAAASLATPEKLRQFLLEKVPAWQVPREWMFVESLEVNQRGKLSRADWRRRFLENRGVQSSSAAHVPARP